jgi:hypothetical protein
MSKLHTEVVPAQHNTRHKANVRQTDERCVSREGLAPIVKAYSRLIPVDGLVL